VFERFTDHARRVVVLAQEEARLGNRDYIGTEHLLLGLLHDGDGIGAQALEQCGVSLAAAREQVAGISGHCAAPPGGHIPFTPGAKKALEVSLREALQLGHNHIGSEHILLGLLRDGEGGAVQVLGNLGADRGHLREVVIVLLSKRVAAEAPEVPSRATLVYRSDRTGGTRCSFCGRDFYEVARAITNDAGVMICSDCVRLAARTIEAAGEPTAPLRPLSMPPRQFGAPVEPSDAAAVVALFERWSTTDIADDLLPFVEDGPRLAAAQAELRRRWEGNAPQVTFTVLAIRFLDDDTAAVRFHLSALPSQTFDGRVVRVDGNWKIGRTTWCDIARLGGVHIPPDLEQDDDRDA
jgi:Clp amino terminal domain, pathogenicity island component/ClpX C4-type zinc finger